MMVLALVTNFAPPLFILLRSEFGLTFEQLGRLVFVSFAILVASSLLSSPLVDRWGPKPFALAGNALSIVGLLLFGSADRLFPFTPYLGLISGAVIYSIGAGFLEAIASAVINSIPSDRKAADMNLLHAFYAIGLFMVVLLTSLAVWYGAPWRIVVFAWSLLPLITLVGFCTVGIPKLVPEEERLKLRHLIRKPVYLGFMLAIFLAGASEMAVAQWISAYADKGLGLPKLVGDVGGLCVFAVMLGAGRIWMGVRPFAGDMGRAMSIGCVLTIGCYLVAALAPMPWLALPACATAGLGVSLLWPGILSAAARTFPGSGASMFAMLAAAGNFGCALAPWGVGLVADEIAAGRSTPAVVSRLHLAMTPEQLGLRIGLLAAVISPILLLMVIRRVCKKSERSMV
jgi:fucose permease